MVIPEFNNINDSKKWLKDKINLFLTQYEQANSLQERKESIRQFILNDFKAEELPSPIYNKTIPINCSPEYIGIKALLEDFFKWVYLNHKINASFELYLDFFFPKLHSQNMIILAEGLKRLPTLSELEQIKTMLDTYKILYETSLNHLKTILEIILKRKDILINKDFGIKELRQNFPNYPRIDELLSFFDNYSRNPISHDSWTYKDGILLFKSKGQIKQENIVNVITQISKHIMFQVAYQALAIEGYQNIIKEDKMTEDQIVKMYDSFKEGLNKI